jgi:hypothetical protein
MAAAMATARAARGLARRAGPLGVVFGAGRRHTSIALWRRLKPTSMRQVSHPICFDGWAWLTCQRPLIPHEPPG